ncbi:DUF5067 domain-containing protein [Candidatus Enterococcus mansonii]|uniref:DUF5067 domain-containing protein n=1 Tax=Candidatus Enterococcus mansonii TaxID=1834181 RepID=A0A242CEV2_9ENTE|nr:DUF5067 domain-containing protein [Enterococcus sp. 4G2_DIV0659]OTO08741.1 hypothetical protein A5880_001741 [Enterococcus sp. 4G2_DIV0659]
MRRKFVLLSLLSVLFLVGCQADSLEKKVSKFSSNGSDYTIQLPSNWKKDSQETAINKSAILSSKDTKSNSGMYIISEKKEKLNEQELAKYARDYLEKYYVLTGAKANKLVAKGNLVINYTIAARYEEKEAWLDVYYLSTENSIVSIFFYSPMDNSYDKRKTTFDNSVKSLEEKVTNEVTEESSEELNNRIQNKDFSLQISTYVVKELQGEKLMAVRYLFTNKEESLTSPVEKWDKYVKVYQGDKELARQEKPVLSDNTLDYLSQNNSKQIKKDEAIESVAVYGLNENSGEDVSIKFDDVEFKNKQPLTLNVNK